MQVTNLQKELERHQGYVQTQEEKLRKLEQVLCSIVFAEAEELTRGAPKPTDTGSEDIAHLEQLLVSTLQQLLQARQRAATKQSRAAQLGAELYDLNTASRSASGVASYGAGSPSTVA